MAETRQIASPTQAAVTGSVSGRANNEHTNQRSESSATTTMATPADDETRGRNHTRSRSRTGLRKFLHSRSPSKGTALPPKLTTDFSGLPKLDTSPQDILGMGAYEFPHGRALGEIRTNGQKTPGADGEKGATSPRKSVDTRRERKGSDGKGLHKKTMSSVSLKSLFRGESDEGKEKENKKEKKEKGKDREGSPKKSKSSTNLAALLSPRKSAKNLKKEAKEAEQREKDKENRVPAGSAQITSPRPPIYAQFSTDRFVSTPQGGRFVEDSVDYFGPSLTSPTDDFRLFAEDMPLIESRNGSRPNSLSIPREYVVQDISRPATPPKSMDKARSPLAVNKPVFDGKWNFDHKPSFDRGSGSTKPSFDSARVSAHKPSFDRGSSHKPSFDRGIINHHLAHKPSIDRTNSARSTDIRPLPARTYTMPEQRVQDPLKTPTAMPPPAKRSTSPSKPPTLSERTARLMASMQSTFTTTKTPSPIEPEPKPKPQSRPVSMIQDVNAEFEAMLDRRNIPEGQRSQLRGVVDAIKIDLVRHDLEEIALARRSKLESKTSLESVSTAHSSAVAEEEPTSATSEKPKTKKSRTFKGLSFSKASLKASDLAELSSFTKGHGRSKSAESATVTRSTSASSGSTVGSIIAKINKQEPDDYVAYLRKPQRVEDMEVGKLHKLRLLLRNETVAWTDSFLQLGGQAEIVALLYRIMEVEWREEHEDQLLHEALLCLKALCTTALSLKQLEEVHEKLFPALLHLIFDEEKKGPSEFSTRNVIISILFAYLQSAPLPKRQERAETLLRYLRDPVPKEEERPLGFVLQMHQERPYRVWCKEVVNVTKEVFWIFLHSLNVIAAPTKEEMEKWRESEGEEYGFMKRHFPVPIPPVPTAPYVGSVEWEATNYITSHLFLLNGILASLPAESRRKVREELRISRWERVMGDSFRTCKEKLYPGLHAALREWVSAAVEDEWDYKVVSQGAKSEEERSRSPVKRNPVKRIEQEKEFLKIELPMPKVGGGRLDDDDGGWL